MTKQAIKNLRQLEATGSVEIDGQIIKIGDTGVTREWVVSSLANLLKAK